MNALQQKMIAHTDTDIINARMAVREFARNCGFGLRDQSCISLVSASVANLLRAGKDFDIKGIEILMEYCENDQRRGMRVTCTQRNTKIRNQDVNNDLKSSFLLVDDVEMRPMPFDGIEVIVTKWDSSYKG